MVTLLHMLELYMALRISGRSSSLQPLLSNSLALNLYFSCPLKKHKHNHVMQQIRQKLSRNGMRLPRSRKSIGHSANLRTPDNG